MTFFAVLLTLVAAALAAAWFGDVRLIYNTRLEPGPP